MGYTGQASFGQNAFAALGGYSLGDPDAPTYGLEPLVALVVAAALLRRRRRSLVGYPTLRCAATTSPWRPSRSASSPTRSPSSGRASPRATWAIPAFRRSASVGYELTQREARSSSRSSLVLLLGVWISSRLRYSRFGRALRAIAGSEPAASALGINVSRYKLAAFVVAALYASVAGSLFAHFVGFISPEVFGTAMVVLSFTMLYLGGIGTTWGPVIGAVIVSLLPEALRGLKELQDVVYCADPDLHPDLRAEGSLRPGGACVAQPPRRRAEAE